MDIKSFLSREIFLFLIFLTIIGCKNVKIEKNYPNDQTIKLLKRQGNYGSFEVKIKDKSNIDKIFQKITAHLSENYPIQILNEKEKLITTDWFENDEKQTIKITIMISEVDEVVIPKVNVFVKKPEKIEKYEEERKRVEEKLNRLING